MSSSFGGSIKLSGESEYRKALKEIDSSLRLLGSEMKEVSTQFDKNDRSTANLASQNEVLTKKITEQEKKVALLREMMGKAAKETGENSETTKKYQTQLNNAQAELNTMNRQLETNKKDMEAAESATDDESEAVKDLGTESEKAKGKFEAFGNGIKKALEVAAAATSAVASGIVAIGKQAIESYADYEQLTGGVETLFKTSSDTVKKYAANAYQTAGLSANEYMETVTGFSASLIKSLGGDTRKAAKMADMAITDMSDNANKMGTDMSSIQSAYQGFAKQNYSMLDNLKLGYGGTQKEMYRLLSDAAKLNDTFANTAEFSIDSKGQLTADYADIVEAIHIVQTEMGITGTTAKEASSTISGSLGAMKSAWGNLLIGVADETQDFDMLINNLIDSILTFGDNIIPRIKTTISGVGKLIQGISEELLPDIMKIIPDLMDELLPQAISSVSILADSVIKILPNLIKTLLTKVLPNLVKAVIDITKSLFQTLSDSLPDIMKSLAESVVAIFKELFDANNIRQLIEIVIELVESVIKGLQEALPILIEGAVQLVTGLVKALPDIIGLITKEIPNLIRTLTDTIVTTLPTLIDGAVALINGLVNALPDIVKAIVNAIPILIKSVIDAVVQCLPALIDGAIQLVKGLVNALPEIITAIIDAIPQIIDAIFDPEDGFLSSKNLGKLIDGAADTVKTLFESLPEIITGLIDAIPRIINSIFDPEDGFLSPANIGQLVDGAANVVLTLFNSLPDIIKGLINALPNIIDAIFNTKDGLLSSNNIQRLVNGGIEVVGKVVERLPEIFGSLLAAIPDVIGSVASLAWDAVVSIFSGKSTTHETNGETFGGSGRRFATGGIVTKPTRALIGEDGTEAVIPLENNTGWITQVARQLQEAMNLQPMVDVSTFDTATAAYRQGYTPTPVSVEINFGDVQMASDMDVQEVAQEIADVITNSVFAKGGAFR